MLKRLVFSVVGLAMGALVGLLVMVLGGGWPGLAICAVIGAALPLLAGAPGGTPPGRSAG